MILQFGKFKGSHVSIVPSDYLEFIERKKAEELEELWGHMEKRAIPTHRPKPPQSVRLTLPDWLNSPVFHAMVQAGYRKLALENHPDKGGDIKKMQTLNAANDLFKKMRSK